MLFAFHISSPYFHLNLMTYQVLVEATTWTKILMDLENYKEPVKSQRLAIEVRAAW